eukprot:COSAG02_NODE_2354_length_9081_cov_4.549544_2_plen_687_part_00
MTPRAVPWLDWAEWEAVRELLIAPEPERRARGVQRVAAWRSRGRLPVSVETTACLVEIWLSERGVQPPSEVQLRLSYSMALLRMVNGICDPSQRGKAASSVLTLARRLGLPPMLVDLRHAATHGSLPALPALQLGASQAMEWLLEKYWRQQHEQAAALESDDRELAIQREVTSALKRYRKWREGSMQKQLDQGQELTKINQDDTAAAETRRCADALAGSTAAVPDDAIVEVFLDGNMLVPKADDDTAADAAGREEIASLPWVRSEVDGVFSRLRCVWRPVVAAVRQRRPRIRAALLYGVIDRLSAEGGGLDLSLGEQGVDSEPSAQSISTQQRLRLGLLQRWAKFLMSADERLWPALQTSVTQIPARAPTSVLELDRNETISRCLRGMNEWLTPLLGELRRRQQEEQTQKDHHARIAKLAGLGCSISLLQRDPVGAVTQLQSVQAAQDVSTTGTGRKPSAIPVLPNCESVAAQLEQWRAQSVERRRLQAEAESGGDATRGTGEEIGRGSGTNEQNSYGMWCIPSGYKPTSIGAPAPHIANPADANSRDDASDMSQDNISAEHMASLELPDFINEVSLYAAMPSPIAAAAGSASDDSRGMDQATNASAREYSSSFHVAGEDDPMGVDATGWDSHGYSLPAPTAFDGSEAAATVGSSAPRSTDSEPARLLSTEDINLHCASVQLVECL